MNDPKSVVVRYVEAVRDGDLDVIRDSFAPDAVWHYPGQVPVLAGEWRGRDTIVNDFLGSMGVLFAPGGAPAVALVNAFAAGNQVLAEWTSKGTAANGSPYDVLCAGVYTVEDGRITRVREFADTLGVTTSLFPDRLDETPTAAPAPQAPTAGVAEAADGSSAAVARRFLDGMRDADPAAMAASLAEDAVWVFPEGVPPMSGAWKGRDVVLRDFFGQAGTTFRAGTRRDVTLTDLFAEGDQVFAAWTTAGTARSGAAYLNHCGAVFTVRDGAIAQVREYADTLHVARVLFPERFAG